MTLINFTKEELYKIEECINMEAIERNDDGDSHGESLCESIIDKIQSCSDLYIQEEEVSK
jgi:hypothetical protein